MTAAQGRLFLSLCGGVLLGFLQVCFATWRLRLHAIRSPCMATDIAHSLMHLIDTVSQA